MTDSSRRGAANLAPVLMIVAFLAMVGFLWWLGATSEGTEPVVMDETPDDMASDTVGSQAVAVTPADLRQADQYMGQDVRIQGGVADRIGDEMFFLDLPQSPFLVKIPAGQTVPQGQVEVVGTVMERTDSALTAWVESGVVSAADQVIVEFATHYIDARRVRRATSGGQGGAADGGGSGDGG
jgi:hypothetical protein